MASNVTPPPPSAPSGEPSQIDPELIAALIEDLDGGKVTVAKVRDALVKLLNALS